MNVAEVSNSVQDVFEIVAVVCEQSLLLLLWLWLRLQVRLLLNMGTDDDREEPEKPKAENVVDDSFLQIDLSIKRIEQNRIATRCSKSSLLKDRHVILLR